MQILVRRAALGESFRRGGDVLTATEGPMAEERVLHSWREPGVPPLPSCLRRLWAGERLPERISQQIGLDLTLNELDAYVWVVVAQLPGSLFEYLIGLLNARSHQTDLLSAPALGRPWPSDLDLRLLPLRERTRNGLFLRGFLHDPTRLAHVTYGELFAIPNFGATSVLDFTCTAEAALDNLLGPDTSKPFGDDESEDEAYTFASDPVLSSDDEDRLLGAFDASWASEIYERDPRFADLFPSAAASGLATHDDPGRSVAELVEAALTPGVPIAEAGGLAAILELVIDRVEETAALPLDAALRQLIEVTGTRGSRVGMLTARLGWGGTAPMTLEEAGRTCGVTRERVRQVESKFVGALPSSFYLPQVERAVRVLEQVCPLPIDRAGELLVRQGVSSLAMHPEGLIKAADLCGCATALRVEPGLDGEALTTEGSVAQTLVVEAAIKRIMRPMRVFALARLVDELPPGVNFGEQDVRVLLEQAGARPLTDNWWWYPGTMREDPLGNLVASIVAVAGGIDIAKLREGVGRRARWRRFSAPPRAALLAFCSQHSRFVVTADRIRLSQSELWQDLLGSTDRALVDVLLEAPGHVLDRLSLQRRCISRGMNLNTFSVYTSYSPYLDRLGNGLWAVRGVPPDPSAVAELLDDVARRPRERRVLDHGWTADGHLRVVVRLSETAMAVVGIPAAVASYVAGGSFAIRHGGRDIGAVRVDEQGTSWGYGPFLSRAGGEPGDVLAITFDLLARVAELQLVGDEALDEQEGL